MACRTAFSRTMRAQLALLAAAPGTSHLVRLRPTKAAVRRALARALAGHGGHVRVGVIMFRLGQPGYVRATGTVI
jgi:hypothetical protein